VKKRQKDISDIDQKIISMYAKGMTTRQISDTLMDIYGFEASEGFISDVTDKLLPQLEEWQKWPVNDIYPVVFIDTIHYSVCDNNAIRKIAAYIESRKEALSIHIYDNESFKYWLVLLDELRNRAMKDILILCVDGLTGIKEAIAMAYPNTEYQRCLVHQVRNTLKYVSDKDRKEFAKDLRTFYNAPSEKEGQKALDEVTATWEEIHPRAMRHWYDNWDAISPILKFPQMCVGGKIIPCEKVFVFHSSPFKEINILRGWNWCCYRNIAVF